MNPVPATRFVREPLSPGVTRVWELDEVIFEGDTEFQHVLIARTPQGVALFCDNERQSTEFSQLVYHEALVVPALCLADRHERVLVVGSSEGVISQIAVAAGASHVDHVDVDRTTVRLCAAHLPYGYTEPELDAAEHGTGPVRTHYADGWLFVSQVAESSDTRDHYDVIVIDLPDEREDEAAQHNRLYSAEFLTLCRSVLRPGGVVASQAGCPTLWRNDTLRRTYHRFTTVFGTVACHVSDEHEWAFLFGRADRVDEPAELMTERLAASPYRPISVDAPALRSRAVPPYHVRHADPT